LKVYRDLFGDLGVAQISYLLDRILSLSTNNLEIELMMLGYTGLDGAPTHQSTEVFDTEIKPIEGEVSKEVGITNKIIKENAQISYEQGVANAEKYNESASLDAILQMGGVLVED
jgi:hypothetical protein